jgi:glycolate oxidase FAD binding subunit
VSVTTRALGEALRARLGPDGATDDPAARAAAAVDGGQPSWVARPRSVEDAARVLALAHDEGLVVLPRGSGSALGLGAPPERADIVLDLGRLDQVLEYSPDDLTVTVQAGVTGGALAAALAARRQTLPVDPPGWVRRTVGGIAATAASGPLRLRYGTMRDLLLGVRFIQADGVSTWGGAKVVKSVTGYDVPKLLVGSLGTLGVIVELTLRLHPLPEAEATTLLLLPSAQAAQDTVGRIVDSTLQPNRLEWLDAGALAACGLPASPAALAISVGSVEAAVRAQQAAIAATKTAAGARVETLGPGFWRTYDRTLSDMGATVLRVGTLTSRLTATLEAIRGALGTGVSFAATACAPLGVLRVAIDGGDPARLRAAIEQLRTFVAADEGSVVIERAPLALRTSVDPWGSVPAGALELMRTLKREFDPRRTLNPGRFVGGI